MGICLARFVRTACGSGRALYHYVAKTEGPPATAGGSDRCLVLGILRSYCGIDDFAQPVFIVDFDLDLNHIAGNVEA